MDYVIGIYYMVYIKFYAYYFRLQKTIYIAKYPIKKVIWIKVSRQVSLNKTIEVFSSCSVLTKVAFYTNIGVYINTERYMQLIDVKHIHYTYIFLLCSSAGLPLDFTVYKAILYLSSGCLFQETYYIYIM